MDYVKIFRAENGFIVERYSDLNEKGFESSYQAFQEDVTPCEKEALVQTLYDVVDALGVLNGKHQEHRVVIQCECQRRDG